MFPKCKIIFTRGERCSNNSFGVTNGEWRKGEGAISIRSSQDQFSPQVSLPTQNARTLSFCVSIWLAFFYSFSSCPLSALASLSVSLLCVVSYSLAQLFSSFPCVRAFFLTRFLFPSLGRLVPSCSVRVRSQRVFAPYGSLPHSIFTRSVVLLARFSHLSHTRSPICVYRPSPPLLVLRYSRELVNPTIRTLRPSEFASFPPQILISDIA